MNNYPKNPLPFNIKGCYLAGGAILSIVTKNEISDYDIYPKTKKDMIEILRDLIEEEQCFIVNISNRAITLKSNIVKKSNGERVIIQIMTFDEFSNPDVIFDTFDFTVCMAAYDLDHGQYNFHPSFYPDVASRTLRFNNKTKYPLNSLLRVKKYQEKGFNISKSELIKIALTIANKSNINSWSDLENQIGGSYGKQIKLKVNDLEYNFENAIDILSNLELDSSVEALFEDETEELYSKIDIDILELFLNTNEKVEWIPLEDNSVIIKDQHILCQFPKILFDIYNPKHFQLYQGEKLFGYKTLIEKEDGILYPSMRTYGNNGVTYGLGNFTEWGIDPYLFVFINKPRNKSCYDKSVDFRVSFNVDDIKKISYNHVQVTKLKVEERLI